VSLIKKIDHSHLPAHIAIVMDGNGRWAKKKGLPRIFGHRAGVRAVRSIVESSAELGVKVLTLYAFSTENWSRPAIEVRGLMKLLERYLVSELKALQKNNIRLKVIGDLAGLPQPTREKLAQVIRMTEKNTGLVLNLALNYGGRQEIVRAVNAAVERRSGKIRESDISDNLDTRDIPDPDMVIRTSGERRISNFLLWQMAYSEFYFTEKLWPDFRAHDLYEAIIDFQKRERRFGGLKEI